MILPYIFKFLARGYKAGPLLYFWCILLILCYPIDAMSTLVRMHFF